MTTATIACSDRRLGSKKLGKYAGPWRFLGINSSISPTLVSHPLGRYPLRCVTRSGLTSPSSAPISAEISPSINSRAINATASRTKSPCSPAIALATTSAVVILCSTAIVVLPSSSILGGTDESGRRGGRKTRSRPTRRRYTTSTDMTVALVHAGLNDDHFY